MIKNKKRFVAKEFDKQNQPIGILDRTIRNLSVNQGSVNNQKTLIICIDGISLAKIKDLLLRGKLPKFKDLINNGISANIKTTIPPDSLPAWPSFITGKNPGKHGIIGYFKYKKETGEDIVVNSSMIRSKRYWDIFSEHDLNSVTMNLPITFPPQEIKGIMISDHLSPQGAIFSYPPELCDRLKEVGYFTELAVTKFFDFDLTDPQPYIYKMNKTKEAALSIIKNYNWDLFTLGFMSPDKAHHMLGLDGRDIDAIYEAIDSILGEILDNIDRERTDIFIVSDHGTTNYEKEFSLHSWLYEKGLIKLNTLMEQVKSSKQSCSGTQCLSGKGNFASRILIKILSLVYRLKVSLNLPSLPFFNFPQQIIDSHSINPCPFDWSKTKVYSLLPPTSNYLPIFINTQGERPFGIVKKEGEYEALKRYLTEELNSLKDPHTQEYVVKKIYEREELFSGEFLNEMPDIVVELQERYIGFSGFTNRRRIINGPIFKNFKRPVLNHSIHGIFIFNGPKAKTNVELKEVNILDLFPTILFSRQMPIPDDIDGQIKKEIFNDAFIKQATVQIQKAVIEDTPEKKEWLKRHSQEDAELLNKELKRLGYIK